MVTTYNKTDGTGEERSWGGEGVKGEEKEEQRKTNHHSENVKGSTIINPQHQRKIL